MAFQPRAALQAIALTLAIVSVANSLAAASGLGLSRKLLSVDEMPKGWSAIKSSGNRRLGCLAAILTNQGVKETAIATISFARSGLKTPELDEDLVMYSGSTSDAFSRIAARANGCKKVSGGINGLPISGTVSELTFLHLGNQSDAYNVQLSVVAVHSNFGEDLLIERQGSVIMEIYEVSFVGSVNLSQFEHFAIVATAKLRD